MTGDFVFPWARTFSPVRLAAFIEDLWGAASGGDDVATLDAIERVIAEHRPDDYGVTPGCPLSERETEILTQIANCATYEEIASSHAVTLATVRSHANRIYQQLGAKGAAQATAVAAHHGWLPDVHIPAHAEPIPRRSPQTWRILHQQAAAAMRRQPGTPVELGPYRSRSGAVKVIGQIRKGLISDFRPAGAFTAELDQRGRGHWVVCARYTGTEAVAS